MAAHRRIGVSLEYFLLYKQHSETFAGVHRYADEHGWSTVMDDWVDATLARSRRTGTAYDGVIARVGPEQVRLVEATARAGVPMVNVRFDSPARERLPGVFLDYGQIGTMRAEHLMSRGLQHFACVSVEKSHAQHLQASAFASTIAAAGHSITRLDLGQDWERTVTRYEASHERLHRWMDRWPLPIGLACPTDLLARTLIQVADERGWRVPEDVAIVGGLNQSLLCEAPKPTLSSVEVGFERVGYEAARLLDSLMSSADRRRDGRKRNRRSKLVPAEDQPTHVILPPVGIVVRESTDFFASGDDVVSQAQAFIASQLHNPIAVGDVAKKLCVSERTLQYRFTAVLKRPVAQEIRRVRIERAKRELTNTKRSMQEIARLAGFVSNVRLCEVFKREMGVSPGEYRKQRLTRPKR